MGLTANRYRARVQAQNERGAGKFSPVGQCRTRWPPPTAPHFATLREDLQDTADDTADDSSDGGWCGVVAVGESAFAIQLSWAGAEDFEGDLLGHRPALSFVVEHRELEGQDERWKTVYSGTIYL